MIKKVGLIVSILVYTYPTYSQYLNHDTDILIINVGDADRYKIAQTIELINTYNPKVIGINLVFTDKRERDTVFLKQLSKSVPIIVPMKIIIKISITQILKKPWATTFVFMKWWAFENVSVHRDQTLNEDKNL